MTRLAMEPRIRSTGRGSLSLCTAEKNFVRRNGAAPRAFHPNRLLMLHRSRHAVLSEIEPHASRDDVRVVIETPKGSRNKYDYNPGCDCMELATVLPEGMVFPYDFGFVPSTLGDDGDPLDVLILMDVSVVPGCVITARLVGAIEAKQKDKGEDWTRNDRLIAIATHAQLHNTVKNLGDLRPHLLEEIKQFFVSYNKLRNRKFKPLRDAGPREARELVEAGIKVFNNHRSKHGIEADK
jgi:inorganic pyrophosphatase